MPMPGEIAFIAAIRMYRTERDLPYDEAKRLATDKFREKGWPIPEWADKELRPKKSDDKIITTL